MALETHLVVKYDHESKTFSFDGDGSREWIRTLFEPETNTWSDEQGDYIAVPRSFEDEAVKALGQLGIDITHISNTNWQER